MTYDPARRGVLLFGGKRAAPGVLGDTWTFAQNGWRQADTAGPPGRDHHGMAFHHARGVAVMYGGWSGERMLGDTWLWNGVAWGAQDGRTGPSARGGVPAMTYDSDRQKIVMYGRGLRDGTHRKHDSVRATSVLLDCTMPLAETRAAIYERCRPQLTAYVARMVGQRAIADDLVQEAALRLLSDRMPETTDEGHVRAWLFKVATRLALDHLRRHSTWREISLPAIRDRAEQDTGFVKASLEMRGSPEMAAIAREHLVVCFSCTLRILSPHQAAALLLREVYDLTVEETAAAVDATVGQAKNWIQEGRAELARRYQATCALIAKTGVCYQCVELDQFFNGERRDPLAGGRGNIASRLRLLREAGEAKPGPWHERLLALIATVE